MKTYFALAAFGVLFPLVSGGCTPIKFNDHKAEFTACVDAVCQTVSPSDNHNPGAIYYLQTLCVALLCRPIPSFKTSFQGWPKKSTLRKARLDTPIPISIRFSA